MDSSRKMQRQSEEGFALPAKSENEDSQEKICGFSDLNFNFNAEEDPFADVKETKNANMNSNANAKASPYSIPDSPEVQSVKATLSRIANQGPVRAVMVIDPTGKLNHVEYPSSGITDFDARHMKLDEYKLLVYQANDFIRDINPRSFLKTLRIRGKMNAILAEFEEDKNCVMSVQKVKFVPLISKQHI